MKILLVLVSLTVSVYSGTDFYELLGVSRSATTKEIRKAFKKLALIKHPDKNADNPEAHEEFLKINRAYETLKDDDLRKKYDTYGEEGLKDDFHGRGRQYESWRYYQEEFGLYDDDPEIITLGHHDFETSVEGSEDIWFINFYSPHCSHCHQLAPTWRELARELEGVIRIGAVNCGDDLMTCRSQGVRAYPTLLLYPQRIKYNGERTTQLLVDFAMRDRQAKVHTVWESTFKSTVTEQSDLPWLMTFCGDGGDCLSEMTALKLSVMLDGLAHVGTVDCHTDERICENLDADFGTRFFPKGNVNKGAGLPIDSLYPKDVMRMVLEQLPDVTVLDKSAFQDIIATLKSNPGADPWIIHFVDGGSSDLELRKLPAMLQDFQIGRVDCSQMRTECNQRHIHKFPTFVVYKPGGSYEIFYGRLTAHDVAVFAKDSMVTPIQTLGPSDFPQRVINSPEHWFVDFFAPWCPPCMRLLPEFRKAAKDMGYTVNFGTVDCTVHASLCRQYQIHSYPTTIFYNRSQPHQYQGHHDATHMAEFLEDTMKPPVVILDPSSFDRLVKGRDQDEVWLVDFFAPWCGPCRQVAPEWSRLAKSLKEVKNVYVGHVDCQAHPHLCRAQGVHSYPSLWLYPTGRGTTPHPYEGWQRDAYSLRAWAYEFLPSLVQALRWRTFQEILQGSEPWIIDFYTPWCGHCQVFKPEFERVAEALEGHVKAGKVDCESYPRICQHAGIHSYPSVRLYPGTHVFGGQEQGAYGWNIQSQNAEEIIQFVRDNTRYAQQQKIHHDEF